MQRFLTIALVALIAAAAILPAHAPAWGGHIDPIEQRIEQLQASLSPVERVGQLMLVTFEGSALGDDTAIAQLIAEYNIGGVVLLAQNDNISGQYNTPQLVQTLTAQLQQRAYDAAEATQQRATPRAFVPLFVATEHAGDTQPGTQIAVGTTPLPSAMAIGATWNPEFARTVGHITGSELSTMGVNMLFGPALDVLQQPQTERSLDLGVNTFGSHPFWVGAMGQSYITGVHEGGQNRVAVIAQHFPGLGFADTHPETEIPVVPRTVEELQQHDLVPFAAVTGGAETPAARADGIQCANVRYQGESVRATTRPVCIDEQAADRLLSLEALRSWRDRGVMVSSALGSEAIRRYYGITPFPHRQVAREAFLAGNDLLYLANFGPASGDDQLDNVIDMIHFFAERYEDDPVFRQRVEESLSRVLRLKLSLYDGDISLANVLATPGSIDEVGGATAALHTIAQESVTLIAPRRANLPAPPGRSDTIVIFTDVRLVQQCSYCAAYPLVPVNGLEAAIERIYGPFAGAQVRPEQVLSFSFDQLAAYLNGDLAGLSSESTQYRTYQRIAEALRDVDWVVFMTLDVTPDQPSSGVVHDFMARETSLTVSPRVVVMALGAPTYLSATEISKLAAYYGIYSHTTPYITAAARALFQEIGNTGALPISVPAAGYDVFQATAPDPAQTLRLAIETLAGKPVTDAEASDAFTMSTGQRLVLRTEPIVDHNGNRVPDGTPVEFTLNFMTDGLEARQYGYTTDGIAYTSFTPSRPGSVQVTASSQEATRSAVLPITIRDAERAPADETPRPDTFTPATAAPDGTATASAAGTPLAEAAAPPTPEPAAGTKLFLGVAADENGQLAVSDLVLALFGLTLMSALGFSVGLSSTHSVDGGIRVVLSSVVAGLIGYIYYGLDGPGAGALRGWMETLAPSITTLAAGLVGLIYAWWSVRRLPPP